MTRSRSGQLDARTVEALETTASALEDGLSGDGLIVDALVRQANALEAISRWPADLAPALNQALQALVPVFGQLATELHRCTIALERIAAAHDGIEPNWD